MTEGEQVAHLVTELRRVVKRTREEYSITVAAAVGAFELVKHEIIAGELKLLEDDGDDG